MYGKFIDQLSEKVLYRLLESPLELEPCILGLSHPQ